MKSIKLSSRNIVVLYAFILAVLHVYLICVETQNFWLFIWVDTAVAIYYFVKEWRTTQSILQLKSNATLMDKLKIKNALDEILRETQFNKAVSFLVLEQESINAATRCMVGRPPVIALTCKAAEILDKKVLKTLMCHEIAHLKNNDYWVRSVLHALLTIFKALVVMIVYNIWIANKGNVVSTTDYFFLIIFTYLTLRITRLVSTIAYCLHSQKAEYEADEFVVQNGYGSTLVVYFMLVLNETDGIYTVMPGFIGWFARSIQDHPSSISRIIHIKSLMHK